MEDVKVGIEGLEKLIELMAKNIALGLEIGKDGLKAEDLKYGPELFGNIKEVVEYVSSKPDLVAEMKDLDHMEGFKLVQKAYASYLEVSKEA